MGFDGLVVSDALEMTSARALGDEVGASTPQAIANTAVAALRAGCDLLISTGTTGGQLLMLDTIVQAAESGELAAQPPRRRRDEGSFS